MLPITLDATTAVSSAVIDSGMLTPLTNTISSNITTLLPVGVTIMSIMIGVGLIPRIIYKFL